MKFVQGPEIIDLSSLTDPTTYVVQIQIYPNFKHSKEPRNAIWGQMIQQDMELVKMEGDLNNNPNWERQFRTPHKRLGLLRNKKLIAEVRTMAEGRDYQLVIVEADGAHFKAGDVFEVTLHETEIPNRVMERYKLTFRLK